MSVLSLLKRNVRNSCTCGLAIARMCVKSVCWPMSDVSHFRIWPSYSLPQSECYMQFWNQFLITSSIFKLRMPLPLVLLSSYVSAPSSSFLSFFSPHILVKSCLCDTFWQMQNKHSSSSPGASNRVGKVRHRIRNTKGDKCCNSGHTRCQGGKWQGACLTWGFREASPGQMASGNLKGA